MRVSSNVRGWLFVALASAGFVVLYYTTRSSTPAQPSQAPLLLVHLGFVITTAYFFSARHALALYAFSLFCTLYMAAPTRVAFNPLAGGVPVTLRLALFAVANLGSVWMIGRMRRANRRVRSLSRKLLNAQQDEARRIARDLHDDLTQEISRLGMRLSAATKAEPDEVHAKLEAMQEDVRRLVQRARDLSHELHPRALDQAGLDAALEEHCLQFAASEGVKVQFRGEGPADAIPGSNRAVLYRIAREALRNSVRHGGARDVWVALSSDGEEAALSVVDDGAGFDPDRAKDSGIGLRSMQERAELAGGSFSIESEPGEGASITVRIPHQSEDA